MKRLNPVFIALGMILILTACGTSPAPTQPAELLAPTPTAVVPTPLGTPEPRGVFSLSVLVDTDSNPLSRERAQAVVGEASQILLRLTDFVFEMADFREYSGGFANNNLLREYLADPSAVPSNGIIVFSEGDRGLAKQYGGYSFSFPGVAGFSNSFVSQYYDPSNTYVAVIHYGHHYAPCGYGDSEIPISQVSVGVECFEQPGTLCAEKLGYSMCSSATESVYASTPTYATAAEIVHELMHAFGPSGDAHHYGTQGCADQMASGISSRPYQFASLQSEEADSYLGLCPFVYDNFVEAYQP